MTERATTTERTRICTDRVLPRELMRFQPTVTRNRRQVRALAPIGKTWPNGSTLRARFLGGSAAQQKVARDQAKWWSDVANLRIEFGSAPDAEFRISFDEHDGAWSYIGTDCKDIPRSQATMNLGFLDGGTAAHEFGHAIGLAHEHQNPAGGIQWREDVVIAEMAKSPNFWDPATTRHNIIRRYRADQINGTQFDPKSIMLYFFPASWTLNGVGTDENEVLSNLDKSFIAGAKMYPKTGPTVATATQLEVNATRRTAASIGKVGEEDLFKFTAKTDGRYVVDTRGPTDVVMKLFGPNSPTALIAEDDDSGLDLNARISANLVAGDYIVQVRHYNKASGMGNYTVKVVKA
jgi:hypothetical protein